MSSNSRIMREFWGLVGSLSWVFISGVICGILLCLYMQETGDNELQPVNNIECNQPQPGYIP